MDRHIVVIAPSHDLIQVSRSIFGSELFGSSKGPQHEAPVCHYGYLEVDDVELPAGQIAGLHVHCVALSASPSLICSWLRPIEGLAPENTAICIEPDCAFPWSLSQQVLDFIDGLVGSDGLFHTNPPVVAGILPQEFSTSPVYQGALSKFVEDLQPRGFPVFSMISHSVPAALRRMAVSLLWPGCSETTEQLKEFLLHVDGVFWGDVRPPQSEGPLDPHITVQPERPEATENYTTLVSMKQAAEEARQRAESSTVNFPLGSHIRDIRQNLPLSDIIPESVQKQLADPHITDNYRTAAQLACTTPQTLAMDPVSYQLCQFAVPVKCEENRISLLEIPRSHKKQLCTAISSSVSSSAQSSFVSQLFEFVDALDTAWEDDALLRFTRAHPPKYEITPQFVDSSARLEDLVTHDYRYRQSVLSEAALRVMSGDIDSAASILRRAGLVQLGALLHMVPHASEFQQTFPFSELIVQESGPLVSPQEYIQSQSLGVVEAALTALVSGDAQPLAALAYECQSDRSYAESSLIFVMVNYTPRRGVVPGPLAGYAEYVAARCRNGEPFNLPQAVSVFAALLALPSDEWADNLLIQASSVLKNALTPPTWLAFLSVLAASDGCSRITQLPAFTKIWDKAALSAAQGAHIPEEAAMFLSLRPACESVHHTITANQLLDFVHTPALSHLRVIEDTDEANTIAKRILAQVILDGVPECRSGQCHSGFFSTIKNFFFHQSVDTQKQDLRLHMIPAWQPLVRSIEAELKALFYDSLAQQNRSDLNAQIRAAIELANCGLREVASSVAILRVLPFAFYNCDYARAFCALCSHIATAEDKKPVLLPSDSGSEGFTRCVLHSSKAIYLIYGEGKIEDYFHTLGDLTLYLDFDPMIIELREVLARRALLLLPKKPWTKYTQPITAELLFSISSKHNTRADDDQLYSILVSLCSV